MVGDVTISRFKPFYVLLALGVLMTTIGYVLGDNAIGIALGMVGMGVIYAVVVSMAWAYWLVHENWVEGRFRI